MGAWEKRGMGGSEERVGGSSERVRSRRNREGLKLDNA